MIFTWLRRLWLWLCHKVVYFLPTISSHEHDSDDNSSSDEGVCRVPCESEKERIFDETDHLPISPRRPRRNSRCGVQHAPKRNVKDKGEIVHLQNPYCVAIINIHFENRGTRNGAQADREHIEKLLKGTAGFKSVHVYCDQRRNDTLAIMENISNSPEMASHDGLVVFISSHGKPRGFQTVDKKVVEVDEMTSRVNGRQCVYLRGKPKLFFISACRGNKADPGVPGVIDSDAGGYEKLIPRLPTEADFLVCYSTTKNHISHRRFPLDPPKKDGYYSPGMGTWLISSLTQVFEERMKDEDVMQMLARVNSRVANMATGNDHVIGTKQMPVQMHMLRHRVFLGSDHWK